MRVGIIGALAPEVAQLRAQMEGARTTEKAGFRFDQGRLAGVDVVVVQSDIGKVNAAIGTTLLLNDFAPDRVINTGSAGGFDTSLEIGDLVISDRVCHHDVDVTPFGYEPGQVPGQPACFLADDALMELAQSAAERLPERIQTRVGLIASGDRFMHAPDDVRRVRETFPDLMAVEMEGAAIAQACHRFGVPFVIIRALSDIPGKDNVPDFDQFLPLAAERSARLVVEMLKEMTERPE